MAEREQKHRPAPRTEEAEVDEAGPGRSLTKEVANSPLHEDPSPKIERVGDMYVTAESN